MNIKTISAKIIITFTVIVVACMAGIPVFAASHPEFYSRFTKYSSAELLDMGNRYITQPNMVDSALVCFSVVTSRVSENMNDEEKRHVMIGYVGRWYIYFFDYFNYEKSYENLVKARRIAEDINDGLSRIDLNFGCMYQTMAEQSCDTMLMEKALGYYRKAFDESVKARDKASLNMAFSNLVYLSSTLGKTDSISGEWQRYNSAAWMKDSFNWNYNATMYRGCQLMSEGKNEEAISLFDEQLRTSKWSDENMRYLYIAHVNKARAFSAMGKYSDAEKEFKIVERIAFKYGMKDAQIDVYQMLARCYAKMGKAADAESYSNKYFRIKDTLLNYQQVAKVSRLQFLDQMDEIEKRMEEMMAKREQQAKAIRAGVCVMVVVVGLSIMLYIKNNKLKRNNEHLYRNSVESLKREERERQMRLSYEQKLGETSVQAVPAERYSSSGLTEEYKDALLNKIIEVMQTSEEIFSPDFRADRLVELVGSNGRYVSQVINEKFGCNFANLLSDYRVKEVCKRLNNYEEYGNLTISAIAESVGFRSHSGFFSAFKRQTGLTPAQYQKLARDNKKEG